MSRTFVLGDPHGSLRGLLQVLKLSNFDKEEDILICLGDVADGWPETPQVIEELLTIRNLIPIMGNHDCLDEETEVFTRRGWLKYTQLTLDDEVIGIDHSCGESSWQKINEVIVKKSDHLNYYTTRSLDFALTDNHRVIYKEKGKEKFSYMPFKEIKGYMRTEVPLAVSTNSEEYPISDLEIKLAAWILTDGGIDQNGYVNIYQSKEENLEYIESILKGLNLEYTDIVRDRASKEILGKTLKSHKLSHTFRIIADSSFWITTSVIQEKKAIPDWCYDLSARQLDVLISDIIRGDGSWYADKPGTAILYGTYEFLSNIQPIFNLAGYSANVTMSNRGDYRLNISSTNISAIRFETNKVIRKEGDFNVWCLSVPFTNFLVRRNGKSYFTGNCWLKNYLDYGYQPDIWLKQGGLATFGSYAAKPELKIKHRDFYFPKCTFYYIDHNNNAYVHGGYASKSGLGNDAQDTYMWDRTLWDKAKSAKSAKGVGLNMTKMYNKLFIGHTSLGYTLPQKRCNVINVDTGAGWEGCLTLMNVETEEYFMSDKSKMLYPEVKGR